MKSELVKLRHARSVKDFPDLKLEENEYVELAIRRSKVGVILIWAGEAVAAVIMLVLLILLSAGGNKSVLLNLDQSGRSFMYLILMILSGAIFIVGLVTSHVWRGNRIFITNKRAIQCSMHSLFAKSTDIIDLVSIEDVSFKQSGIAEYALGLGTLRMSTVGDETTYIMKYIDKPIDELDIITHLVHIEKEKTKHRVHPVSADDVPDDVIDNTADIPQETILAVPANPNDFS
ncbi:PH domain-containing protein [Candidatus Saccharibacteria bacterium]|nr:PH domain-containing protein [Candidatus Saccharibacteria bacterium]